jgi:hypothetical protein
MKTSDEVDSRYRESVLKIGTTRFTFLSDLKTDTWYLIGVKWGYEERPALAAAIEGQIEQTVKQLGRVTNK